jgi:quinol monooxygenase YgiN
MITLISRWKLKKGCNDELINALIELSAQVEQHEPNTITYNVHIGARNPLDPNALPLLPPAKSISGNQQNEIVFYERYANAKAFSDHVSGDIFNTFRTNFIHCFYQDPDKKGWPQTDNTFLELEAAVGINNASY